MRPQVGCAGATSDHAGRARGGAAVPSQKGVQVGSEGNRRSCCLLLSLLSWLGLWPLEGGDWVVWTWHAREQVQVALGAAPGCWRNCHRRHTPALDGVPACRTGQPRTREPADTPVAEERRALLGRREERDAFRNRQNQAEGLWEGPQEVGWSICGAGRRRGMASEQAAGQREKASHPPVVMIASPLSSPVIMATTMLTQRPQKGQCKERSCPVLSALLTAPHTWRPQT